MDENIKFVVDENGDEIPIIEDKMISVSEGLLEDIRHELVSHGGLYAFDKVFDDDAIALWVNVEELIILDFTCLIEKIDMLLENEGVDVE